MMASRKAIPILFILAIILSACAAATPDMGGSENALATRSALEAQVTQLAMQAQIDGLQTQLAASELTPSVTATPLRPTLPPTDTPLPPTKTPVPPTPTITPIPVPCNQAEFITDVTVRDGTTLPPRMRFTKTWRFKNAGSCDWTPAYSLVFVGGDKLGNAVSLGFPGVIAPGQEVDLSIEMTAPASEGSYRSYWKLRDEQGSMFGIGQSRQVAFFVDINVVMPQSPYPLNFVDNYCLADWNSGAGQLPCQGDSGDSRGFVRRVNNPILESGYQDDQPVLLTHPQMIIDGVIRGKYPPVRVENGDHFVAVIGCAYRATECDVNFQLDYQIGNGSIRTLDTWHEIYDGEFNLVDVDLTPLAGEDVSFILTVFSNGSPNQDYAQWLDPHISPR